MGTTSRIFELHRLLSGTRGRSLQQLMEHFEVSRATIKRDIELMRDQLGAPILYDRDTNRYHYGQHAPAFELPGLWFNASELHALLAAEQLLEAVQPGLLAPQLEPLKARIRKLLEKSGHSSETVTSRILLQPMGHRRAVSDNFATVAGALLEGRVLDISYLGRGKGARSERRIHPQRLLHYRDNWYLIAHCEKADALRTFALDRIEQAKAQQTEAETTDEQQLQRHLGDGFGIFSGDTQQWAILRFTAHMARWVADEQWHPEQKGHWRDDHYELHIPYTNPTELLMDILKYGPEVEVIAPEALRAQVRERLEGALGIYRG
jgi:predicted DNA-binding transcriptional regulator YafY